MRVAVFISLLLPALAMAQPPAGITPCILGCATAASSEAGCSSSADLECICKSNAFASAEKACLETSCTPEDQEAVRILNEGQCAAFREPTPP
ncbi:hypothetical protein FRB95_003471 [Tulasnella sp. JGI-2019a]|nr:hypothetical protein FRB95_003471 [Tulasnella sp. JGI-2019a]